MSNPLNVQASFPSNPKEPTLGSICHQQADGQVPICVVTDLQNNFLLTNSPGKHSNWVVTRARVNITRMWTSSTALIKCTCELTDQAEISPPLTFIEPFRSHGNKRDPKQDGKKNLREVYTEGLAYPLTIGDEICIYFGYLDYIGQPLTSDMLGTRLLRTFVGCIDIITEVSNSSDGLSVTIECRDRLKYITDSYSSFSAEDLSETILGSTPGATKKSRQGNISRPDLILTLAQRAVGDFTSDSACAIANCGYRIEKGELLDPTADNWKYDHFQEKLKSSTTHSTDSLSGFPTFHILSTRLGFAEENPDVKPPTLSERIAIETIKFLSLQENLHTEVFCHHVDGNMYYVPRLNDASGLEDKERFYRTYFNRISPPGFSTLYDSDKDELHPCQKVILYREEQTLLSTKSNILVKSSKDSDSEPQKYVFSLKTTFPKFKERSFPCSYFSVFDDSLSTALDYISVGIQYARRVSKEVRACSVHLIGDPSLSPSEIIQVITSSCNYTFTKYSSDKPIQTPSPLQILNQAYSDRKKYQSYYDEYKSLTEFLNGQRPSFVSLSSGGSTELDTQDIIKYTTESHSSTLKVSNTGDVMDKVMCELVTSTGDNTSVKTENINYLNLNPDPQSIWRIEALTHRFNDGKLGYYTELALLSPF